ncbi:MAG: PIN domain-containing protein [Candidatus Micrarchaeota archaeon]|nr:PIN domain-containing protein [Candidatus Micrarchaeota archaeon]
MVVLDTSILIHYLHGNERIVSIVDSYLSSEKVSITCINEYELLKGSNLADLELLNGFIATFNVYWMTPRSVEFASGIYKKLKGRGKLIDDADILIAGITFANGEILLTSDKDFEQIGSKQIKFLSASSA